MSHALRCALSVVFVLVLALPAAADEAGGEGEGSEESSAGEPPAKEPPAEEPPADKITPAGEAEALEGKGSEPKAQAPPAEAEPMHQAGAGSSEAPAPLDPAVLARLQQEFVDQFQEYSARAGAGQGVGFDAYLRDEFEYYEKVGYGIVLGVIPAVFATSLGIGIGYCDDGMAGEDCRAAAMGSGVPVVVAVAILGGTFITTYGMKLDKMDKILGSTDQAAEPTALRPHLAPVFDQRGRPGGVAAGFRF